MSTYADDIRRIAKQKENNGGLGAAEERPSIAGSTKAMLSLEEEEASGITPPLTLEILTYDDTKDVEFTDTSSATHTLKTAATARITDANDRVFDIETITFATPP